MILTTFDSQGEIQIGNPGRRIAGKNQKLAVFPIYLGPKVKAGRDNWGNKSTIMFLKYLIGLGFDLPLEENLLV